MPGTLDGVRVDRAVSLLTGVSRSAAAEMVAGGRVTVDGRSVSSRNAPLAAGAVLSVVLPEPEGLEPDQSVAFGVVHEDEDVAVVDKPAGLVVHPGAGHPRGTLVNGLLARFPGVAAVGDPRRPGIVHRLDRGTSGLLVVALTPAAHRSLVAQLAERRVGRRYLALVAGHVHEDRGAVDAPIGRSARTPTLMVVSAQGRPARTRYTVLRRLDTPVPASLLAVTLETGRTHQVRVHLAAVGHPVVGDTRCPGTRLLEPGRLFLHAAELSFDHPATGARMRWTSPLPPDLATVVGEVPDLAAVPDGA